MLQLVTCPAVESVYETVLVAMDERDGGKRNQQKYLLVCIPLQYHDLENLLRSCFTQAKCCTPCAPLTQLLGTHSATKLTPESA